MTLPSLFIEQMKQLLGDDFKKFEAAMALPKSVAIRLNSRKPLSGPPYEGTPVGWCAQGLSLPARPLFTLNPLLHAGCFYVQEASSMIYHHIFRTLAGRLASSSSPLRVLDTCAAPGGKTTAIIDALPDDAVVVANEFVSTRANILAENLAKWGSPNCIVCNSDTEVFSRPIFDIVAVDAPCSGEGMMRGEPAAVDQWSPRLVESCATLQRQILDKAAMAVKPGGFLVFSTCTYNQKEDEENARYVVDSLGFMPVEIPVEPAWNIHPAFGFDIPAMRFIPGVAGGEGLFATVFQKNADADADLLMPRNGKRKNEIKNFAKIKAPECSAWVRPDFSDFHSQRDSVYALSAATAETLGMLTPTTKTLSAGIEVATAKGRDFVPSPKLAMSLGLRRGAFPEVEADETMALAFLRREALTPPSSTPKGYVLLTFSGYPLGFMKNLGFRANNLYPNEWRIRIQARD